MGAGEKNAALFFPDARCFQKIEQNLQEKI